MSVALRGNIEDFGIAEIFQLIGQQRKSGALEFTSRGRRIQILFDRGAVVSAAPAHERPAGALADMLVRCGYATRERVDLLRKESESAALGFGNVAVERGVVSESGLEELVALLTRESLFEVLRWSTGSFDFKTQQVDHDHVFESMLGAEQILMDGLRMVDEWNSLESEIPSEKAVVRRVGDFERLWRDAAEASRIRTEDAERVCLLIDGRLSVRRIIDLSRLGTFAAMYVLVELLRGGLIESIERSSNRRSSGASRVSPEQVRGWLAAALPIVLLIAASLAAQEGATRTRAASASWGPGLLIEHAPLAAVRAHFATLRAKHAVEDFRMTSGEWPADWEDLERAQPRVPGALATSVSRPYYYARRDGAVVLTPMR